MLKKLILILAVFILTISAGPQETVTYEYDALGRLIKVNYPSGIVIEYEYDKAGNRLKKTVNGGGTTRYGTQVIVLPMAGLTIIILN